MAGSDSLRHLRIASSYVGLRELSPNRHPVIDRWNTQVGAPLGSPYCASFVSFVLDSSTAKYPPIRTARSRAFVRYGIPIDRADIRVGGIFVWIRKGGGHIGFVRGYYKSGWRTIEANTSSGRYGSQYNGDGVWERIRYYEPFNTFRITHYVPVH